MAEDSDNALPSSIAHQDKIEEANKDDNQAAADEPEGALGEAAEE